MLSKSVNVHERLMTAGLYISRCTFLEMFAMPQQLPINIVNSWVAELGSEILNMIGYYGVMQTSFILTIHIHLIHKCIQAYPTFGTVPAV